MRPSMPMFMASSSSLPSPLFLPRTSAFTPISERDEEEEAASPPKEEEELTLPIKHNPTPLHPESGAASRRNGTIRVTNVAVDCIRCMPSIVPVIDSSSGSPNSSNGVVRTLFSSLSCKNSRYSSASSSSSSSTASAHQSNHDKDWKRAATEVSRKLGAAAKKRDEALLEASQLRETLSDMEKKIARLECYSDGLRSALHRCGGGAAGVLVDPSFPVSEFICAVTESRTMARYLSRFILAQARQAGRSKMFDRIVDFLGEHGVDVPAMVGRNASKSLALYLESILSLVFYENFESPGFERNGSDRILDPFARCESIRKAYRDLKGLSWEEVLQKGTRHYSEELSRFCDRKMREVVEILGWSRSWPEPILQAFFGVAKWVWLVHLLARSVHPVVPVFRVGKGARFDRGYMEDAMGGRAGKEGLGPVRVQVMVAPGFYVYSGVIKCKVICMP